MDDPQRFLGEIAMAIIIWLITWGLSKMSENSALRNCQDERVVLLHLNSENQRMIDSVHYGAKLAEKKAEILQKDGQIIRLQEKMVRDSIRHLTELESIRAINAYIDGSRQPRNKTAAPKR